jgi:uncharacterized protein (TIGR03437 family)
VTPAFSKPGADGLIPKELAGVKVSFDGTLAPLLYVSSTQMNTIVPFAVAGKTRTHVVITYNGNQAWETDLSVNEAAPGLFTSDSSGRGQAAVLNQDFGINSTSNAAARGSIVVMFATGAGQTDPPGVDGMITQGDSVMPRLAVSVLIGGQPADVIYAGNAPGLVAGAVQVNARIPQKINAGQVSVLLSIGGIPSQSGVTLAVR